MLRRGEGEPYYLGAKLAAASYFQTAIVSEALGLEWSAGFVGAASLYAIPAEAFTA
jgi:hypothetical protein